MSAGVVVGIVAVGICYVALMNYLGGEKYLLGNRIYETAEDIKKIVRFLRKNS